MRVPSFEEVRDRLREIPGARSGDGASEEDLARAEERVGVALPDQYRSFLRTFGWAEVGPLRLLGVGPGVTEELDLTTVLGHVRPTLAERYVPVARRDDDWFCLDSGYEGPYSSPVYSWRLAADGEGTAPEYAGHDFSSWLWMQLADL